MKSNYILAICVSFFTITLFSCGSNEIPNEEIYCEEFKPFPEAKTEVDFDINNNRILDNNYYVTKDYIVFTLNNEELCVVDVLTGSYNKISFNSATSMKKVLILNSNLYLIDEYTFRVINLEDQTEKTNDLIELLPGEPRGLKLNTLDGEIYISAHNDSTYKVEIIKYSPNTEIFELLIFPEITGNYHDVLYYKNETGDNNLLIFETPIGGLDVNLSSYNLNTSSINYTKTFKNKYINYDYEVRDQGVLDNQGRAFLNIVDLDLNGFVFNYLDGTDLYETIGYAKPLDDRYAVTFKNKFQPNSLINIQDGTLDDKFQVDNLVIPFFIMSDNYLIRNSYNSSIWITNIETGCNDFHYDIDTDDIYVFDIKETEELVLIDFENNKISKFDKF